MTQAYPLQWPQGRQRRSASLRKRAKFNATGHNGYKRDLTVAEAMSGLQDAVDRIGGGYATLSSDLELRLDGLPRSGQSEPDDPGVCLYFELSGNPVAMPCDTYDRAADNIAAIAAHIDATRAIERHGVASVAEMFSGFTALPAPDAAKQWWDILEVVRNARREEVERAWKRLRKERRIILC